MAIGSPFNLGPFPFGPNDAIFVFNGSANLLKYFHANGMMQWSIAARGVGSSADFGKNGSTPPGIYALLGPQQIPAHDEKARALGPWFVPLEPVVSPYYSHFRRTDIGVHGGGSDLPNPLATRQGWETTLGCIRLQNGDLRTFVSAVQMCKNKGFNAWITVQWYETDIVTKKPVPVPWAPPVLKTS
jgi:hypothetical protein